MLKAPPLNPRTYIFSVLYAIVGPMMTFLVRSSKIQDLQHFLLILELFEHIFKHVNALSRIYIGRPRNVGPRIKRGCFKHLLDSSSSPLDRKV